MNLRITSWLAPKSRRLPQTRRNDAPVHRRHFFRPQVELLEDRLPPGSLFGWLDNLATGSPVGSLNGPQPLDSSSNSVSGEAYGATVVLNGVTVLPKTPDVVLPSGGGMAEADLLSLTVPNVLSSQTLYVWTTGSISGSAASSQSEASVENVNILNGLVTAQVVVAMSSSTSNGSTATSSAAGSAFVNLVVNGVAITAVPPPNTTIPLPGIGSVILNEEIFGGDGVQTTSLTVNMIHVSLNGTLGTGDIIVSSAHSDVSFTTPTQQTGAAFMTGGGRIGPDSGFATFGFHAGNKDGVPQGTLNYIDHANGMHVKSTAITSFSLTSTNCATFSGTATLNGNSGYSFSVNACDNGEPGVGRDTFAITVSGPGLNYSSAGFGDVLTGGNIQLHFV